MREYIRQVAKSWWGVIGYAGLALAIIGGLFELALPPVLWISLLVVGLIAAQVDAHRKSRLTSGMLSTPLQFSTTKHGRGNTAAASGLDVTDVVYPVLDPNLLRGRVYPYSYAASIQSSEPALAVRVALATRVPRDPEPLITSAAEETFKEAIAGSWFESWLQGTGTVDKALADDPWRSVEPTRSTVATLRRQAVHLPVDGWEVDARSSLIVRPQPSIDPPGWSILLLDWVIRPNTESVSPGPISLDGLVDLVYVMTSTVLDEIAPKVLSILTDQKGYEPLSAAVLVTASGRSLSDFVPLVKPEWKRAEGAHDPLGGEWLPDRWDALETPRARANTVRGWIKELVRNAGVRGHEHDIDTMTMPDSLQR